jgi:hypothetical protein
LGFKKGVAVAKGILRYEIDGIEMAISVDKKFIKPEEIHSRGFEAEIMASKETEEEARNKITKFLDKLGLKTYKENEFYEYIEKLNKEANGVFDYEIDSVDKIRALGR